MNKRRILSVLLAILLVCSCFAVQMHAADKLKVSAQTVAVSEGETVDVAVVVAGNTGLRALGLDVSYDAEALTLLKAENAGLFPGSLFTQNDSGGKLRVAFIMQDPSDANGTLLTLHFKINADQGDFPIGVTVTQASTTDENGTKAVAAEGVAGRISVTAETASAAPISLTAESKEAAQGDTVEIAVSLSGNTGLRALGLDVSYDAEALTLLEAKDSGLLKNFLFTQNAVEGTQRFAFVGQDPSDANGTLITLSFKVKAAEGSFPIALKVTQATGVNDKGKATNIASKIADGAISVVSAAEAADPIVLTAASKEAAQGDTVEIGVSLSGNTGLRALGLDVSYDADALTLLEAKDAGLFKNFLFTQNAVKGVQRFAFVGQEPSDANGTLITLSFKVKAAEGSFPVSLKVTQATGVNDKGKITNLASKVADGAISVVPVTEHHYGEWTKLNESEHQRVCADDPSHIETAPHEWNKGKVTTKATCESEGVKTYTCNVCKATKTEVIPATGHAYGDWTKLNDNEHQRVCANDASHVETAAHTWNKGKVTTKATCEADGVKTYTCTVCKAKKTEVIPATGHAYGDWTELNENEHQRVCANDASHVETAAHEWNEGKVVKEPAPGVEGEKRYVCKDCGAVKSEPIKAIPDETAVQPSESSTTETPSEPGTTAPSSEIGTTAPPTETTQYLLLGDVDCDGKVQSKDARKILRHAAKVETLSGELTLFCADVNGDGKVNAKDARLALRIASKLDPQKTVVSPF